MCKFTYLGYTGCEEPDRHYLIRREKCTAKAHLKHWCAPHEQEEVAATEEDGDLSLPCPMCADVPIVHDQPLLEIAHSRRSVLPAPYYDAATGRYSRYPRHHAHNTNASATNLNGSPALVPKPLNMGRVNRVHFERSASESAVQRVKRQERSPDYKLPAATYQSPEQQQLPMLPATTYQPSAADSKLPKTLPIPQPMTITPPSSRDGSLSPPQDRVRLAGVIRTTPPGESSRCELDSLALRERAKAAANKDGKPATDRSRSGSESSTSSFGHTATLPPPPPPPRAPTRKPSLASSTKSSAAISSPPSKSNSVNSHTSRRTQRSRQDSTASSTLTRSPPTEHTSDSGSLADRVKETALRKIGFGGDRDRTDSPDRGRRMYRLGSSSERSNSPTIWRPTISQPQLQMDSLGMAANSHTDIVQSFKQRLVPFAPSSKAKAADAKADGGEGDGNVYSQPRPKTPHPMHDKSNKTPVVLRLYPNKEHDEKVAMAAFNKMFQEEQKVLAAARHELPAAAVDAGGSAASPARKNIKSNNAEQTAAKTSPAAFVVDKQTLSEMLGSSNVGGGDPFAMAGVGRSTTATNKALPPPPAPQQLRRVKTGQVKTVTVTTPDMGGSSRKRANTSDVASPAVLRVKTGGPLFRIAGVGGGARAQAQEFEIVSGGPDGAGQAF